MTELTLSRPLNIHCFEVFAEIAKAERREEIQSVLLLAQEHGGRLTPDLVCRELLGGRPPVVGRTVLQRCRGFRLMEGDDDESYLTEEGRESASRGVVFIPEKGKYRLWVTDDPLFTGAALDVEPVKEAVLTFDNVRESRHAHIRGGNDRRHETREVSLDMKSQAEELGGRAFTPLKPGSQPYRINFVGPEWVRVEGPTAHPVARITWTTSDTNPGRVRVDGAYHGEGLAPPPVPFQKIWFALLGPRTRDWEVTEDGARLRCAFEGEGLTETELRAFHRTLEVASPSVPELGEFDPLEVEDVRIAPRELEDAQAWAEWLLEDRISSYQDRDSFAVLQREVSGAIPEFRVSLPNRSQLVKRIRQRTGRGDTGRLPAAFWYIQAPRDLVESGPPSKEDESRDEDVATTIASRWAPGDAGKSSRKPRWSTSDD